MSYTSRTGLVPTSKKSRKLITNKSNNANLPQKFEALPMALSLRPFSGLFNPFAKGCSVLCNHPAPAEVKQIISRCKHSLSVEGKNIQYMNAHPTEIEVAPYELADNIPEDLFRRYTDTDSRPLTPTPTVTSIHTRTSAGSFLNNRRCITPELANNDIIQRKQIILDLRRSHSQETLCWKPGSDVSSGGVFDSDPKTRSAGAIEENKNRKQKIEEQQRPKSCLVTATILEESGETEETSKKGILSCINEQDFADGDIRRGKRRKKIKAVATTTTFHLNQDPETQVATLGPDSLNPSTRPSLVANAVSLPPREEKRTNEELLLKDSFLTNEVYQTLKTKLDVDLIENTFDTYLNRAYREAYKYLPPKPTDHNEVIKELDKLNMICEKMPRKFSKCATRFDVPMDLASLENMSVICYLSKYVWVSRQRQQIFKRIFLKYLELQLQQEPIQQQQLADIEKHPHLVDYHERSFNIKHLYQALEDVLEFYGTKKNISNVLELINYEKLNAEDYKINFRLWCGIVAFAERLALDDPSCTDSCDELERTDFNSLELRLEDAKVPQNLKQVFKIIRNTHSIKKIFS